MNVPTITFVITSYNEPARLQVCLETLSRQLYRSFNVVVSDDGSSELGQYEIAKLYGATWLTRERDESGLRNIPMVANQAIPYCTGDIIAFLQQDHIVQPDYALWLARCFSEDMIMFGLLDRRYGITPADLNALVRNLHLPEEQTRYDYLLDQGRRILVEFEDWRLTDGFDFAIARSKWKDLDTRFVGPGHAILDVMLQHRLDGLRFVLNPMMRLWHWEHEQRDPVGLPDLIEQSRQLFMEKWGQQVWDSSVMPKLYSLKNEVRILRERYA